MVYENKYNKIKIEMITTIILYPKIVLRIQQNLSEKIFFILPIVTIRHRFP